MLKAVFFDLDGTLLPMEQEDFIRAYFGPLCAKVAPLGVDAKSLVEVIWQFIAAAAENDGSVTNETVFWQCMGSRFGGEIRRKTEATFDAFYREEFHSARSVCGCDPRAKEIIELLHSRNIPLILATNPIFPAVATEARVDWAGLKPSDFLHITTMENSTCAKPNPRYYGELLRQFDLSAEDCLMVGNDVQEDGAAAKLGMPLFFLTDHLIDRQGKTELSYPHGDFDALKAFLQNSFAQSGRT